MSSKSLQKYLRKYMSKDDISKKKKGNVKAPKKTPIDQVNTKQGLCKIVDDDIDMKNIEGGNQDLMDLELGEDAPQIAGIVDERPVSIQAEERFGSYRWKSIADDSNETRNESPVRKTVRKEERSVKKTRNDSDSDSDQSVSRSSKNVRQRNDSDSDQSVSRSSKNVYQRHDSDSDLSPPRKSDDILSKLQKNDFDLIDKRAIRQNSDSDSDLSPERNIDKSSMISGSEKKLGKIRVKNESDSDLSPPRVRRKSSDDLGELVVKKKGSKDRKKSETLDGKVAGLQKAADVRAEGEKLKKREKEWLEKMDTSTSGRDAVAIVRDRSTGKRVNLVEKERREREKKAKQAEREAKYQKWGKGLKQIELTEEKLQNDLKEMSKPLARYANDADLDKLQREQVRDGDPMLKFLRKKKKTPNIEQGIVDEDDKPKYNGCAPPNRFKIRPGYRWDGVDRSNGFERDRFTRLANSQAQDVDIYKWSIEDM